MTGDGDRLRANGIWVVIVHGFSLPLARVLSYPWHFDGKARCAGGGCELDEAILERFAMSPAGYQFMLHVAPRYRQSGDPSDQGPV